MAPVTSRGETPAPRADKMFDLRDRVAIVTGGAGLLGREYADALAQAGANVVVADRLARPAETLARTLTAHHGPRALGVGVDVSRAAAVERMVQRVLREFGRIDILVNNAALTAKGGSQALHDYFAAFEEYPLDIWHRALGVNLTGVFLCCRAVGRAMLRQGGGVIVNVASTYGVVGPDQRIYRGIRNPYRPGKPLNTPIHYSVTKGALISLTRYLATYWAGKNIRVNALTPGGVREAHDRRFVKNYAARTPLGRMAQRDEYRGAMLFLVSDASSYMTGANLVVDGGWTAW